jgi:hypothetical protein
MRDQCFSSIVGVGDYFFTYKVLPRDAADLMLAADNSSCLYEDTVEECHDTADDDFDGFTDCADFSCQAADPTCLSDTTIQDIQTGTVAAGTAVRLTDVIVTGRGQRLLWVQEAGGGMHSGVAVFDNAGISMDLVPGDIVTVEGTVTEFMGTGDPLAVTEITNPVITETGSGPVPAPEVVPLADLANDVTAEPWEGVLVQIEDVTVVSGPDMFGEWVVGDGTNQLHIDDVIFVLAPPPMMDDCFSRVAGPFHYSFAAWKLEPRDAADFGACP